MLPFLAKIFDVNASTLQFLIKGKSNYAQKFMIIVPITIWSAIFYQVSPLFLKATIDILTEKYTFLQFGFWRINFASVLETVIALAMILLFLEIVDIYLAYTKDNFLHKTNHTIEASIENNFTEFLTRFDSSFLAGENNMRLISHIQWEIHRLESDITSLITTALSVPVSLIAFVAILPLIHPYLLVFVLITAIFNLILENLQSQRWRQHELVTARQREEKHRLQSWMIHYFNRAVTNGWLQELWKFYAKKRTIFFGNDYKQSKSDRKFILAKGFVSRLSNTGVYLLAAFLVISGNITIGTFVIFEAYTRRMKGFFDDLGFLMRSFLHIKFELAKIDFILTLKSKLDYSNIIDYSGGDIQEITIKNLNFVYPRFYEEEKEYLAKMKSKLQPDIANQKGWRKTLSQLISSNTSSWQKKSLQKSLKELERVLEKSEQNQPIIKDFNYTFKKGKIYALVGYNGAGKTTLTRLIKRALDPTSGTILIDKTNLKTIEPTLWRQHISSIEQNSLIWPSVSVRTNILLGSGMINSLDFNSLETLLQSQDEITDEQIWQTLKKVDLDKDIHSLDDIVEENIEFSGGQEQLLELARVHLQHKPLIILDEGTNQLDAVKEAKILSLLQEVKKDSIVLFITHRMTTCAKCDEILVLDEGKLAISGTHQELLKDNNENLYQKFWNIQVVK